MHTTQSSRSSTHATANRSQVGLEKLAYSYKEVGSLLSVSVRSVTRLVARGELRVSKALRKKLIPRQSLLDFLERTSR